MKQFAISIIVCLVIISLPACLNKAGTPAVETIADMKRGEIISCGPADGQVFGTVSFTASVPKELQPDFNIAIALLHSFEYDEAEKMFARVIDKAPACAMAYWGVAMANFHALWAPPTPAELQKGLKAIGVARSIDQKTERESAYIEAMASFYEKADQLDYRTRLQKFERAMEAVSATYPDDKEAAIFYSLALNAAADPKDKTFTKQKKAIQILDTIFQQQPLHPGVAHYIIHNSDYPELAVYALPAARKYASIAPSSAHAQHMPSHIFTRLGLWKECTQSNLASVSSAKCYAEQAKMKGHWDEELHGMDYLVYAYLQRGDDDNAGKQLSYLQTITEVYPVNFKTAYAFAAIPSRWLLERKQWEEAASLALHPAGFPWEQFPWQQALVHFTRILGSVHTGNLQVAKRELVNMQSLYKKLLAEKEKTKEAAQVAVQLHAAEAWILLRQGNKEKALDQMTAAVVLEESMEKHPVTPGEVIPARELLAEMLLEMNEPAKALNAFEQSLKTHPNRLNGLYGAGIAAQMAGDTKKAVDYFTLLLENTEATTKRTEVQKAKQYLQAATTVR